MPGPTFPLWPIRPNWSGTVTETLSWMTDVLVSKTGKEQRRILREFPKKQIEYISILTARERAQQDNFLTGRGTHDWMLPLWYDLHYPEADIEIGSTFIPCSTAMQGEFRASGWLVLVGYKGSAYEVVQIQSFDAAGFTLTEPVSKKWPAFSHIFPLQRARFTDQPQLSRKTDATITGSYRFIVTETDIRSYLPRPVDGEALITNDLVSRQSVDNFDGSIFDPSAGITVGHASMMIAFFKAYDALKDSEKSVNADWAIYIKDVSFKLLDAFIDGGQPSAAMIRQPITADANVPMIPHWLYATRDGVVDPQNGESIGEIGEAYEMFPSLNRLPLGFASAAPESFRDLDRTLAYAIDTETRGPEAVLQWSRLREALRRTNLRGRSAVAVPFSPGVNPFRISGDATGFRGFRGSPWISAQLVDMWSDLTGRVGDVLPNVLAGGLSVYDGTGIVYPISPTTSEGTVKSPEALLAEQMLTFMRFSQNAYQVRGGDVGPFAETFIYDNAERSLYENAPVNSWYFKNLYQERESFFQLRAVESIARLAVDVRSAGVLLTHNGVQVTHNGQDIYVTSASPTSKIGYTASLSFVDTVVEAVSIAHNFVVWFEANFLTLVEVVNEGVTVTNNGLPVVYAFDNDDVELANPIRYINDPALSVPDEYYVAPHTIALFLRTNLWLAMQNNQNRDFYMGIVSRCWRYLERLYKTSGEFAGTWASSEEEINWYQSEIVTTLSEMLLYSDELPIDIDKAIVEERLVGNINWFKTKGITTLPLNNIPGLTDRYFGHAVLTDTPNETQNIAIDVQRLIDSFDDSIAIPIDSEYTDEVFNRVQHQWQMNGRDSNRRFRSIMYGMKGRAVPFWYPTHMRDLEVVAGIFKGDTAIVVENVGYTISGGPRRSRRHIAIKLRNGSFVYRQIIDSEERGEEFEALAVSIPFDSNIAMIDIARVSFMDLMRLDQDGIQFGHITDESGSSNSQTVFKSVKTNRA